MRKEYRHQRMAQCMAMQKTTLYLPDDLKADLKRWAAETHRSEAEIIRETLRQAVAQRVPPMPCSGIFASGDPSLSERVDELLSGFGEH